MMGRNFRHVNRKNDGGQNFLRSAASLGLTAGGQLFGGMLMGGSNHVKGWRDSQVNYNIAEDIFFFLNLNKFFINGVTEISSYQYHRRDSRGGKQSLILSHNFTI